MSMQEYELTAWLGDVDATPEQRDLLLRAADAAGQRYPGEDLVGDREQAFATAAQLILGDTDGMSTPAPQASTDDTLEGIAAAYHRARAIEREAMVRLTGAIIAADVMGMPETKISAAAGVQRMTVRKALSK